MAQLEYLPHSSRTRFLLHGIERHISGFYGIASHESNSETPFHNSFDVDHILELSHSK